MTCQLLVTLLIACYQHASAGVSGPDVAELSLLPLNKLLAVKQALDTAIPETPEDDVNVTGTVGAEALRATRPPWRRGGGPPVWIEEEVSWKGGGGHHRPSKSKGEKVQAIFQGTVTVLAFLAFGGYLVCMILNAIKKKEAALSMTVLTTVEPPARVRRATRVRPQDMYEALSRLAEGYAKYNDRCLRRD